MDVVQELCLFAAKLLDYTRKARSLSPAAMAVRDAFLAARKPAPLLFKDLPAACGLPPFDIDEEAPFSAAERFVQHLNEATSDLQNAYSGLLKRITQRVAEAVGQGSDNFDRAALTSRAARVSLAAREPRLRAFALRLRDPGLSDEAWAESLASFVVARPPVGSNASLAQRVDDLDVGKVLFVVRDDDTAVSLGNGSDDRIERASWPACRLSIGHHARPDQRGRLVEG